MRVQCSVACLVPVPAWVAKQLCSGEVYNDMLCAASHDLFGLRHTCSGPLRAWPSAQPAGSFPGLSSSQKGDRVTGCWGLC